MNLKRSIIAVAIAAVVTVTALSQYTSRPQWLSPAGSWEGVVTSLNGGPPPFRMLMTFTSDGGFIGSADGDNAVASPAHGVWEQIGSKDSRTYSVTFRQIYYNPDSSSTGSVTVRQKFTLNDAGDAMEGPAEVKIYAPDGTHVFTGLSTATAARIQSDPLL